MLDEKLSECCVSFQGVQKHAGRKQGDLHVAKQGETTTWTLQQRRKLGRVQRPNEVLQQLIGNNPRHQHQVLERHPVLGNVTLAEDRNVAMAISVHVPRAIL
jgi:hypothetical protein